MHDKIQARLERVGMYLEVIYICIYTDLICIYSNRAIFFIYVQPVRRCINCIQLGGLVVVCLLRLSQDGVRVCE